MTICTGRSAIPVSAVSLSQINLRSMHTKRTRQGKQESTEILKLLPITISSSELLSVRQRLSYIVRLLTPSLPKDGIALKVFFFQTVSNQVRNLVTQTAPRKYGWTGIV